MNTLKDQHQGIALILVGILLMLLGMSDPWIPIIGVVGNILFPLLALAFSVIGLILVFKCKDDE